MFKKLSREYISSNILISIFLNVIIKPLWVFGVDRTVQNNLGPKSYGLFISIYSLLTIFGILLDFGLNHIYSREIAENNDNINNLLSPFLAIKLLLFLLYISIIIIFFTFTNYDLSLFGIISMLVFQQFFFYLIVFLRSILSGKKKFVTDSIFSTTDRIFMIIYYVFYIIFLNHTINLVNYSAILLMGEISCFLILIFFLFKFEHIKLSFSLKKLDVLNLFVKSFPLSISVLFMAVISRFDIFLLYNLVDDHGESSGLYAGNFRLLDFCYNFIYILTVMMIPTFTKLNNDPIKLNNTYKRILKFFTPLVLIFCIIVILNSKLILSKLYTHVTTDQILSFSILMPTIIFIWIQNVYLSLLIAKHKFISLLKSSFFVMVISILFNLLLIPKYGYLGASIVNLASSIMLSLCFIYLINSDKSYKSELG